MDCDHDLSLTPSRDHGALEGMMICLDCGAQIRIQAHVRIDMQGYSIGPNDRLLIVAPADLDEDVAEEIAAELVRQFGDRVLLAAGDFAVHVIPPTLTGGE